MKAKQTRSTTVLSNMASEWNILQKYLSWHSWPFPQITRQLPMMLEMFLDSGIYSLLDRWERVRKWWHKNLLPQSRKVMAAFLEDQIQGMVWWKNYEKYTRDLINIKQKVYEEFLLCKRNNGPHSSMENEKVWVPLPPKALFLNKCW